MLDARSADYIPSKATLGHSQGHSILCPIQLYTIPYTTLYNSIQPRLMSLIRPPPPLPTPQRIVFYFCILMLGCYDRQGDLLCGAGIL